jgi:thymidylate synthase (FAD)
MMKIIDPSVELINPSGAMDAEELIETVARTCYKSEDAITPGSARKFVQGLIKREHTAMLEHATIIFQMSTHFLRGAFEDVLETDSPDLYLKYINVSLINTEDCRNYNIVSTNVRVLKSLYDEIYSLDSLKIDSMYPTLNALFEKLYEFGYSDLFPYQRAFEYAPSSLYFDIRPMSKEELLEKNVSRVELMKHVTHTIKFVCDRGVSHELVRHRPCSFAQESTRYCNYTSGKFGSELTFIRPCFFNKYELVFWADVCEQIEARYVSMINLGHSPQEARCILPNSLKTELIITANEKEWDHILDLRLRGTTGKPHPQMIEVMEMAHPILKEASDGRIE